MRKTFRPSLVKDRVVARIYGLISVALVVPLVFSFIYIYANYVQKAPLPPSSATALFWVGVGSETLVAVPIAYAISSLLRSKVILTDDEIVVINGFREKTVQLKQVKEIAYKTFSKGLVGYKVSQVMPYEAGVIVYQGDGREHNLELPMGWHYLQDLIKELKNVSSDHLSINEQSFERWRKWYETPTLKRAKQVFVVIIALFLWILPPISVLIWIEKTSGLSLSDFQVWLFGGLGIAVYTWLLLLLLKGIDAIRKRWQSRSSSNVL